MQDSYLPRARHEGLVIQPLDDELLLFDPEQGRAHSLNSTIAAVWRACDGMQDREQLADRCGIDQDTLQLALERLRAAHLLDETDDPAAVSAEGPSGVSRRLMIHKSLTAGAALGVAIPVIRWIVAPSVAAATSPHKHPRNGTTCHGPQPDGCGNPSLCSKGSSCCKGKCIRGQEQSCVPGSICFPNCSCISGSCGCFG